MSSIEFAKVEQSVLYGLKQGSAVLKELNKEMDLDMVEKLMSDTAEGIAYQEVRSATGMLSAALTPTSQEVSALLSSRISAADEEDVLAELAALQAETVRPPSFPLLPSLISSLYRSAPSFLRSRQQLCQNGRQSRRSQRKSRCQRGSRREGKPCWLDLLQAECSSLVVTVDFAGPVSFMNQNSFLVTAHRKKIRLNPNRVSRFYKARLSSVYCAASGRRKLTACERRSARRSREGGRHSLQRFTHAAGRSF